MTWGEMKALMEREQVPDETIIEIVGVYCDGDYEEAEAEVCQPTKLERGRIVDDTSKPRTIRIR